MLPQQLLLTAESIRVQLQSPCKQPRQELRFITQPTANRLLNRLGYTRENSRCLTAPSLKQKLLRTISSQAPKRVHGLRMPAAVSEPGLVAHWKFDEGSGTTASDASGNGNTGTLINGPQWTAGKVGNALYFDGIDDVITVADSNSLDLSSAFTLSAWVNPASTSTNCRMSILVKNDRYYLYANVTGSACADGVPLGGFSTTRMNWVCQSSPVPTNTWTHLTLTYNGSALTLYQNGVAVATSNVSGTLILRLPKLSR